METVTWGAIAAVTLFVISVAGFIFKLTKDHDVKVEKMIKSSLTEHAAIITQTTETQLHNLDLKIANRGTEFTELRGKLSLLEAEVTNLRRTSVRQEEWTELKSDVKTLMARLADMRDLILTLKSSTTNK